MSPPNPKQATLIAALLAGQTLEQAAQAAGVAYSTAKRWHADPAFVAELTQARRAVIGSALDVLTGAARDAAQELATLATMKSAPPYVRLRAAEALLERLHKWVALEDMAARVAALEARYADEQ